MERIYIPGVEQHNLLNALADKTCTRTVAARFYAGCIIANAVAAREGMPGCEWGKINAAVRDRWAGSLEWIKRAAWKIVKEQSP